MDVRCDEIVASHLALVLTGSDALGLWKPIARLTDRADGFLHFANELHSIARATDALDGLTMRFASHSNSSVCTLQFAQ